MLEDETILSFSEAAKKLPSINGRKPHGSTLWRWARRGIGGIRLESRRLGGRFVTSMEALERFSTALSEIPPPSEGTCEQNKRHSKPQVAASAREKQVRNAMEELRREGL